MPSYYDIPGIHHVAKPFKEIEGCTLEGLIPWITRYTWSPYVYQSVCLLPESEQHSLPCGWHRHSANFKEARFVAFDIDNTDGEPYTLEAAINDWQDSACIIATTKSHQREKVTGNRTYPPQDRFRIITEWERPITCAKELGYNVKLILQMNEPFDPACSDAGRMFFPCEEIVFTNFEGIKQPVRIYEHSKAHIVKQLKKSLFKRKPNQIPPHVIDFIENGKVYGQGRNTCIYVTTLELLRCGIEQEKVVALIEKSPFDRASFSNEEMMRAIKNGVKAYLAE